MSLPSLRPYQLEDVAFLSNKQTAGIFNEQRTGKTPTAIVTIQEWKSEKYLIVCPASAIPVWQSTISLWTPTTPVTELVGTKLKRLKLLDNWQTGAAIISYGCLKTTAKGEGLITQILSNKPDAIIFDEAHRIKDPKSAQAKAAFACNKIPHRLVLTGTPASGKPEEIYSLLKVIDPKQFSSYWKFIAEYFRTRQAFGTGGRSYIDIVGFQPGKEQALQQYLATCSVQRKRKDVMPWLPAKDYIDIKLRPTAAQQRHLKELKEFFETEHVVTQGVLDRLIRYRQICLDPALLGLQHSSPKQEWVLQFLEDYSDSVLIFSKFTSYLLRLQEVLQKEKYASGIIVGATSLTERARQVADFQAGKLRVLLLNIDAGKEALTLDRAESTIFLDQYPPASDIQQAEDRFVATTPEKADKAHKIYRLMMRGTYDEQIYKLIEQRASAIDLLNDYHKYLKGV